MGFIEDNEYFINIELNANMKNLTDIDKNKRYASIEASVRGRLRQSYENSDNKFKFYEDSFEIIQKYDLFYLLLNLVFDENKTIFTYLSRSTLKNIELKNENLFVTKLIESVQKKEFINNDFLKNFVQNELAHLLGLKNIDWKSISINKNEIVKKFAIWIIDENKNKLNIKSSIYGYILFCYIWNNNEVYKDNLSLKGIVFYDTLNKEIEKLLEKGIYTDLNRLIKEITFLKDLLFVSKEELSFPFMIDVSDELTGYLKQKEKFYEYVHQSIEWSNDLSKISYAELFKLLNESNEIISNKINTQIINKLDNLEIPKIEEISTINNYDFNGFKLSTKKNFLKRLYIY